MKRITSLIAVAALSAFLMVSCSSENSRAQMLYDEGKYQELIDQYSGVEAHEELVMEAKERLAEKLIAEGKYEEVIQKYPETRAAMQANQLMQRQQRDMMRDTTAKEAVPPAGGGQNQTK